MLTLYATPTDPTAAAIARTPEMLGVPYVRRARAPTPPKPEEDVIDSVRKKSHQRLGL